MPFATHAAQSPLRLSGAAWPTCRCLSPPTMTGGLLPGDGFATHASRRGSCCTSCECLLPACRDTALLTVALPPLPCRLTIYRDMSGDSLHRCCLGAHLGRTDQPGSCNHSCVGKLDAVQHLCMCKVPAPASNGHHDKLGCLSFPPLQARLPPGNAPRLAERVGSSWHPVPERLGGAVPPGGRRCEMCLGGAAAAGLGSGHEGRLGETVGAAGAVLKSGGAELVFWTIVSSPLSRAANAVPLLHASRPSNPETSSCCSALPVCLQCWPTPCVAAAPS